MNGYRLKLKQLFLGGFFVLLFGFCWPKISFSQFLQADSDWSVILDKKEINNVDFLSKFLQINSITGHEKKAGEFLKSVCEQNGLYTHQLGNEEDNYNFAASIYPLDYNKPNVILLNHIDVVPPGDSSEWKYPPFQGRVVDGEVWGRGAIDMKGIGVAQLFALLRFKAEKGNQELDFNITFLAVSGEEVISDNGADYVVERYIDLLNPAVVFCEGPMGIKGIVMANKEQDVFGLSVADKKPLRIKLRLTHNTFAHGSSAPANYSAKDLTLALSRLLSSKPPFIFNETNIGMLKGLGNLEKGVVAVVMKYPRLFKPLIVSRVRKDPRMMIFYTNSITLIDYKTVSHSTNSLPQSMECRLDCRLLPEQEVDDFIASIKKIIDNPDIEVLVCESLPGTKPSSIDNEFYTIFETAIKKSFPTCGVVPALLPGYSDCIHFRTKGILAYGSNPFPLSNDLLATIHNFDERIPISALNAGSRIYYDFLLGLSNSSSVEWQNY